MYVCEGEECICNAFVCVCLQACAAYVSVIARAVYICVLSDTCPCVGVWVCGRGVIHVHCWAVNHSVHNAGRQHIRQYERC